MRLKGEEGRGMGGEGMERSEYAEGGKRGGKRRKKGKGKGAGND